MHYDAGTLLDLASRLMCSEHDEVRATGAGWRAALLAAVAAAVCLLAG